MDQSLLPDTFVRLADTIVSGFDMIEFLYMLTDRSVTLLGASAVGVLLADPGEADRLRVVAASSERARLLELFQLQANQGPCLECFRSGRPVESGDLRNVDARWPRFAKSAIEAGFLSVSAFPMRLRAQTIGALNMFHADGGRFNLDDFNVGQGLADVATIGLLHARSIDHAETVSDQLQAALNSRIAIEQAKGKLAERLGINPDQAFRVLRDYARSRNRKLADLANAFVGETDALPGVTAPPSRH